MLLNCLVYEQLSFPLCSANYVHERAVWANPACTIVKFYIQLFLHSVPGGEVLVFQLMYI